MIPQTLAFVNREFRPSLYFLFQKFLRFFGQVVQTKAFFCGVQAPLEGERGQFDGIPGPTADLLAAQKYLSPLLPEGDTGGNIIFFQKGLLSRLGADVFFYIIFIGRHSVASRDLLRSLPAGVEWHQYRPPDAEGATQYRPPSGREVVSEANRKEQAYLIVRFLVGFYKPYAP